MTAGGVYFAKLPISPAYLRLQSLLEDGRLVVLDGGLATELEHVRRERHPDVEREPWGSWALDRAPEAVEQVHRRYVDAGADIITTNTWSLIEVVECDADPATPASSPRAKNSNGMPGWTDIARDSIRLARRAIADRGRRDRCAVAFAINDDVARPGARSIVEVLTWVWDDDPPDLVLLESLSRMPGEATLGAIDMILETGLPVWVSFKRCRYGFCDSIGQHRDPEDGERFREAIRRLDERGVGAVLLHCVRPDELTGAVTALAPDVDLPLGVYPSLGRATPESWAPDEHVAPERYAQLAIGWRQEGAQIIGGCCGVTPAHVEAVAALVEHSTPR